MAAKEKNDMLTTKTGGAYIPPAKLKLMQEKITDKSSAAYQRLAWESLKKSVHGLVNKVNTSNIAVIACSLFEHNLIRGRGLLCRSLLQAQAASPTFTNVYAALAAIINSKFPVIGELLVKRLVLQFRRSYRRNDKGLCVPSVTFLSHLVNQAVCHEITVLELLTVLIENPTNDSIEVALTVLKECGQRLTDVCPKGMNAIFDTLRNVLHEGKVDLRVQYMIEVMFQIRKDKFKDFPTITPELDLIDDKDQFTHIINLDDTIDTEELLNVFRVEEDFEKNDQSYNDLKKDILGTAADEDDDGEDEDDGDEDDEDEDEDESEEKKQIIVDKSEAELIAFRRTVYLTIHSSLDFEECAHKLLKMQFKPGDEIELCNMFIDCCAEQRTYEKFYGLLAERFCRLNRVYQEPFQKLFIESYSIVHRFDTNKLRNVAKFYAHLLFTDAISWEVLSAVRLNEEETTSSSRIFIKILFQELCEYMGLMKLNNRIKETGLQSALEGLFPRDNPKDTRFSINFFTSIGLGGLTDDLREFLKTQAKKLPSPSLSDVINVDVKRSPTLLIDDSDDSDSESDISLSSETETDEEEEKEEKKEKEKERKLKRKHKSSKKGKKKKSKKRSKHKHKKKKS